MYKNTLLLLLALLGFARGSSRHCWFASASSAATTALRLALAPAATLPLLAVRHRLLFLHAI